MIVIDSEFQSLIPPLSDDEYEGLEKSLVENGYQDWREPIITWNGTIIDGHNRYNICDEHGIKFRTMEMKFESRDAAKIWIIKNQAKERRNLSKYDRSALVLQLEPLYAAEAKRKQVNAGGDHGNQHTGGKSAVSQKSAEPPLRTDEQLAKLAGVSRDTIRKVKVIEQEAAKGNQTAIDAREAVKSGEKSIHKAYIEVRPKGDKTDMRPICTICGKPIDDGDSYDHDRNKHKSCAVVNTETHRGTRGGRPPTGKFAKAQYAEDGRRVCSICGEPINEGDSYDGHQFVHKKCHNQQRSASMRKYRNPTIGDTSEVLAHDKAELRESLLLVVQDIGDTLLATINRYETMGVKLGKSEQERIIKSLDALTGAVKRIKE